MELDDKDNEVAAAVTASAKPGTFDAARLMQLQWHYRLSFHERLKLHESMARIAKSM